jgi:hypothetical protein
VFILFSSPPPATVFGLIGAYIGSASAYFSFGLLFAGFEVGNGGKAQSKFDERISGDGGAGRNMGAVALRIGLANGDRDLSPGVAGETPIDGDEPGVSGSCWNGRSGLALESSFLSRNHSTYSQLKCPPLAASVYQAGQV